MSSASPLRKRTRLSQGEARDALLEAGQRLLVERGLGTGLGLITLNDAVVESGVPRASAYRAFTDEDLDPQEAFRIELLISYIEHDPLEYRREAMLAVAELALAGLDSDHPVELAAGFREGIRLAFAGLTAPLQDDPNWRVVGPSLALTALTEWAPSRLVEAHRAARLASVRFQLPLYQAVIAAAGLRLRPEFEWESWGLIVGSGVIVESITHRFHPELSAVMRPTGPDGELQPWSQAALLVEGLALTTLEADPDATVSADLASWIR